MKRILSVALGVTASVLAVGAMAAVAGPIIYRGATASPTAHIPSVMPTVREDSPRIAFDDVEALAGEWEITDGSSAGYTVGSMVNGSPVTVSGTTQHVTGSASVDDSMLMRATIVVDVASITTDNANRDAYFRGPALDTDDYPTASFSLSSPVKLTDELVDGQAADVLVSGTLNLHGVTHTVDAALTARLENGALVLDGSVPISFADYGVAPIDLGFVTVDDSGSIDFVLAVAPR